MSISNRSKNLVAIFIGFFIALGCAEMIGRLVPLGTGFQTGMNYTRFHPQLGFEIDPEVKNFPYELACLRIPRVSVNRSGRRSVRTNSESDAAADGTLKIAVLGDSFMMGREVADGEEFASQLARTIAHSNVMNFGVPGYGAIQAYLSYTLKASQLKPDVTILGFLDVNDVIESSAYLSNDESLVGVRPFFSLDGSSIMPPRDKSFETGQDSVSLQKVHHWLKNVSFSYHMIFEYVLVPVRQWLTRSDTSATGDSGEAPNSNTGRTAKTPAQYWWQHHDLFRYLAMYQRQPDDQFEAGWHAAEKALLLLRDAVIADGGHFVLMLISADNAAWIPHALKLYEAKFGQPQPPGFDLNYPAERLRRFARENDIDVLDLRPAFAAYRDKFALADPYFHFRCDGHWSPLGHHVAAQSMAAHLIQQGIIDPNRLNKNITYMDRSPQEILGDEATATIFGWGKTYRGVSATATQ